MKGLLDSDIDIESAEEFFDGQWCCHIRPAPPGLSFDTHYTFNQVLEAIRRQRWYPRYCYYCYCCPLSGGPDAYEKHIIRHHPGKLAYPGNAPLITVKILEIIEERERMDAKVERKQGLPTSTTR
jgi:hypothetical protein